MDLGLALKAAASAPTTFSTGAESDSSSSAPRPSGLRRADPNSGFSGDLSSTLASRPPRARPSSLDQRTEPSGTQSNAPSREHARIAIADAFQGDLASVLSGARRQVLDVFLMRCGFGLYHNYHNYGTSAIRRAVAVFAW
jgi:hypothetical protein